MEGKTVVITGASSGIGRATAEALASQGARLVLVGRNPERCEEALAAVQERAGDAERALMIQGDLSTQAGIWSVAEAILERAPRIDVLVNNAGVTLLKRSTTSDGFETTFAVNHLAYYTLTAHLLPRLRASAPARIVSVASDAHRFGGALDFDDLQHERSFSGMKVYGRSKTANILWNQALAERLEGSGITANCLHPGGVSTNLGAGQGSWLDRVHGLIMRFMKPPEEGARTSVYLASSPEVEGVSGRYYAKCREHRPKPYAADPALAERLWTESEKLTGVVYP